MGVVPGRADAAYGGGMEDPTDAPEPDLSELFDEESHAELVCRVCGALVPRTQPWPRSHWDWHEAANGA